MTCKPGGNKRAVSVSALLFYEMSSLPYHRRIGLVGLPCFFAGTSRSDRRLASLCQTRQFELWSGSAHSLCRYSLPFCVIGSRFLAQVKGDISKVFSYATRSL